MGLHTVSRSSSFSKPQSTMFGNARQSLRCSRFAEGETTMAQRHQRGWLKKETRSQGETWVLFFQLRENAMACGSRTSCRLVWLETFPRRATHGPKSNDCTFTSMK